MKKQLKKILLLVALAATSLLFADQPIPVFPGKKGPVKNYPNFEGYTFTFDGRSCTVIVPKKPLPHRPWVWRARFLGHQPQADLALLNKGYFVAYIDVANQFGSPTAVQHWNKFYDLLVKKYKLSPYPALEGMSRGGLIIFNWAKANPEKVGCIYGDNPVCDFKSWPGGKGKGKFHARSWKACMKAYGFKTEAEALAYKDNPIDNLTPLARACVPILIVCGTKDNIVPGPENEDLLEKRYKKLGGKITIIRKKGAGHHPHSLKDPTPIVDFILAYTGTNSAAFFHQKLRHGLQNCRIKFEREKKGRVAFLGGSITFNRGWRPYVCTYLKKRFPDTKFDFVATGIPSTGSVPGAFRFSKDVFRKGPVDLLFEEAAVNDNCNYRSDKEQLRGMEGIVRQARLSHPEMDVVLLHFVDPDKIKDYNEGRVPGVLVRHEKVADYYQTPSINLAQEIADRIRAGQFTWRRDFRNLHPSRFGQNLYFRSIKRLLDHAWAEPLSDNAKITPNPCPKKPLDPFSYYKGRYVDLTKATHLKGFKINPKWKPTDVKGRPGFMNVPALVATQPGAQFSYTFKGTAVGLFLAAGPDAGIIEYSIDKKPFQKKDLFTKWSVGLHLPWVIMLDDELTDATHTVVVRLTAEHNPKSKGTACRIIHLLAN